MNTPLNVLITGANSGLGAALALNYARRGARLFLLARNIDRLKSVTQMVTELSSQSHEVFAADVTNRSNMEAIIGDIEKQTKLDLVIANAGVSGVLENETQHDLSERIFTTNVNGVMNTIYPAITHMKMRGSGHIAVVSSIAGFCGLPSSPAYAASKAAVNSLCDGLRPHLKRSGVTLSLICPGFINTPLVASNPYPMPFIMSAEAAAERIAAGLDAKKALIAFPKRMYLMVRATSVLPPFMRDRILGKYASKESGVF